MVMRSEEMDKKQTATMTVEEASKILGISPQAVRVGIEQGVFPWGVVVHMKRNVYIIYRSQLEALTGKGRK
jgi:hypothetical protein